MFEELKELITRVMPDVDVAKVTPESRLVEDLEFDSLGKMMLAMAIEDKYGIKFTGAVDFLTVQDVINYVENNK